MWTWISHHGLLRPKKFSFPWNNYWSKKVTRLQYTSSQPFKRLDKIDFCATRVQRDVFSTERDSCSRKAQPSMGNCQERQCTFVDTSYTYDFPITSMLNILTLEWYTFKLIRYWYIVVKFTTKYLKIILKGINKLYAFCTFLHTKQRFINYIWHH